MSESLTVHNFQALGSSCELQFYSSSDSGSVILSKVLTLITSFEANYSRYRNDSIISKINAAAGTPFPVIVDDQTADLIDYAALCYEQSEQRFDLTAGVLRRAWNFSEAKLPESSQLAYLLSLVGWGKVEWNRPVIRLPIPGMELDLGGIGKEYLVDLVAQQLLSLEVEHALINLGGDIRAIGPHQDGSPWSIGLRHPRKMSIPLATIELGCGSLATSGDYERFFELDGKRYSHLLDARTGWPIESFQSVTVKSALCLNAGIHCTLAMLLGEPEGLSFLHDSSQPYVAVTSDGQVYSSEVNVPTLKVNR